MIQRHGIWLRMAPLAATLVLGACAQMQPAPPPVVVAANPPPVAPGPSAVWYHVSFASNATTIDPAGRRVVADVAAYLAQHPASSATIIGRTDSVGSRNYNMHLSHRRADVVRDALVYKANVAAERVETRWTGEPRPAGMTADMAAASDRVVDIAIH